MNGAAYLVEVEEACLDLIYCKRQPGSLRISRHACALRYLLAQKSDLVFSDDEFGIALEIGLKICQPCPVGRFHAKAFKEP